MTILNLEVHVNNEDRVEDVSDNTGVCATSTDASHCRNTKSVDGECYTLSLTTDGECTTLYGEHIGEHIDIILVYTEAEPAQVQTKSNTRPLGSSMAEQDLCLSHVAKPLASPGTDNNDPRKN